MLNRKRMLTAVLITFLLVTVAGVYSSLPVNEHKSSESTPGTEDSGTPESIETSGNVNLKLMMFVPTASNEGGVYYICRRGSSSIAYFGVSKVQYLVDDVYFTLEFPGSNQVVPMGELPTGSTTNYFYGSDSSQWKTGLVDYEVLRYRNLYPGIDLIYRMHDGSLKYEFVVTPQGNPGSIQIRYPDADEIDVYDNQITVSKSKTSFSDTDLWTFQDAKELVEIDSAFEIRDTETIGFSIGSYEESYDLIIDPILLYSTVLGNNDYEVAEDVEVENDYIYITGLTGSPAFPTMNAYNSTYSGNYDCFVTKFSPDGQSLIYSTFLGGSSWDWAHSLAVKDGYAYITGYTESPDFPAVNAYDSTHNGDEDCFVTKFSPDGQSLVYSTYIGGTNADEAWSIVVDGGYAYITGDTYSSDYPTVSAYDSTHNGFYDCFVTKLSIDGQSLISSTFLGATWDDLGRSIAVENDYVYVTGFTYSTNFPVVFAYDSTHSGGDTDCFLTKFSTDLLSLVYSTYIGGTSEEEADGLVVEGGYVYIAGFTDSNDFPTVNAYDSIHNGGQDIFLTIFAPSGNSLVYSTFLGGSYDDEANDLAVDGNFVYITGLTHSADFPIYNAYDWTLDGPYDCFVSKLAIDSQSLISSTYLGGSFYDIGEGIFVDRGYVYIAGFTQSDDFPMVNAYDSTVGYAGDCFMCIMADDSDMDGLTDREEATIGTNPLNIDSDNDNFLDAYEVEYGSDPLDAMSYPAMPQSWYDAIYDDLDGNATLIQQVISWLDGNHTAIETLFFFVEGNASLLLNTVNYLDGNSTQLDAVAALVSGNANLINLLNASMLGNFDEIREVIGMLGASVGDLDYDGLDDLEEISYGTDVDCIDTDCDNLNDAFEVKIGTDPLDDDSDGDSYLDGIEVIAGTDPLNAQDYPGATTTPPPVNPLFIGLMILGSVGVVFVVVLVLVLTKRRKAA